MKTIKLIVCILLSAIFLNSCMTTRTPVHEFKESKGQVYKYSKAKQCYLFWGLIPLGRRTAATPINQPCEIRTSFRFIDAFVSVITGGIFSMQTIKVMAKRTPQDQDFFDKGDRVTYKSGSKYKRGEIDSIIDGEKCVVKTEEGKLKKMKMENLSK